MTLNMTLADIIVSFIVGIVGSVLIAIANEKIIGLQRRFSDWWAKRSKSSLQKRLKKIEIEIALLTDIREDFKKLYKYSESLKSTMKLKLFVSLALMILGTSMISITSCLNIIGRDYLSPKGGSLIDGNFITIVKYASISYITISCYYMINGLIDHLNLRKALDSEKTIKSLTSSAENLRRKL